MKDILEKFVTIAKVIKNVDASKYRAFKLKQQLMKATPNLYFVFLKGEMFVRLYILKTWILLNWLENISQISLKTRIKKTVPFMIKI